MLRAALSIRSISAAARFSISRKSMSGPTLEQIKEAYLELGSIPTPAGGRILTDELHDNSYRVETRWSQMDIIRKDRFPLTRTYFLPLNDQRQIESPNSIISCPVTSQESGHLWDVWSPTEALRAVILGQKPKDGKGEEQFFLQIWNSQQLVKSINLSEKDKHGKVYNNDNTFGWCSWSYDEGHVAYLAEAKSPKKFSYFSAKAEKAEGDDNGQGERPDNETEIGTEFDFLDDWGEQMDGKSKSVLCVLDIETETVMTVDNIPEDICPGQAIWCPDDTGFIFVGMKNAPYRLGSIYCEQRPSAIFHLDLASGSCKQLSADNMSVCTPRFSPNGHFLIWLENRSFGPHRQCKRLMLKHWKQCKEMHTVIDFIHKAGEEAFPGIFCLGLPRRCWSSDSRRIIFHSEWRSQSEVMVVDTISKLGCRLPDSIAIGHAAVVDVHNDLVLVVQSSPSRPHHFVVAALPDVGAEESVQWMRLPNQPAVVEGIQWKILTHVPDEAGEHPEFGRATFQSILMSPDLEESSSSEFAKLGSLVVIPHGGPHGVITAQFLLSPAALCRLGFSVLLVNYRGSTGFGQDSIDTLPGRVGSLDVLDCQQAVNDVLAYAEETGVSASRLCVYGGSHGGFLTVHLIGQYPGFYKVASCRNPVINLATHYGTSDIPDWVYFEAGHCYRHGELPNAEILASMWAKSPLRYADQIRTPLLIALGAKDRRVPPQQGFELYKTLLSRGVPVKLSLYPDDCHPIDTVPACSDAFVNMVKWFVQHLNA